VDNEEGNVRGARAYAETTGPSWAETCSPSRSDSGISRRAFSRRASHKDAEAGKRARARIADIATLLAPLHATHVGDGHGGTDIEPMTDAGVPQIGLDVDNRTYFDYHHSEADTLDKVDPQQLADDVAAVAVLAYVVADLPGRVRRAVVSGTVPSLAVPGSRGMDRIRRIVQSDRSRSWLRSDHSDPDLNRQSAKTARSNARGSGSRGSMNRLDRADRIVDLILIFSWRSLLPRRYTLRST
jgi:hypothetical protein